MSCPSGSILALLSTLQRIWQRLILSLGAIMSVQQRHRCRRRRTEASWNQFRVMLVLSERPIVWIPPPSSMYLLRFISTQTRFCCTTRK